MSASADDVAAALNGLWTIKPDSVTVTKQDLGTAAQYTVTFDSRRGGSPSTLIPFTDFKFSLSVWRLIYVTHFKSR